MCCLTGSGTLILLPLYQEHSGLLRWEIGAASASCSLSAILIRVRLGGWVDRYGYRPFIFWGALVAALGTLAYPLTPRAIVTIMLLRAVQGVALAAYFTALWARMVASAPAGRVNEVSGWFGISGLLSGALGPILAEQVQQRSHEFPPVFWLGGGLGLLGAIFSLFLRELPRPQAPPQAVGFAHLLARPALAGALLGSLLFGGALGCFNTFISPFVASCALPGIGLMYALYISCSILVRLQVGSQADRLGPARVILPALACVGGGMLALSGLAPGRFPLLLLAGLLMGAGHGLAYPALSTLTQQRSGTRAVGTAASLFTAAIESGLLLGAALAGVVAHHLGYATAFAAAGTGVLLGSALFARWETNQ